MGALGFFVGALIPAFVLSRLAQWIMKSWDGGWKRLTLAHVISLLCLSFLGADGDAFPVTQAASMLIFPQLFWFVIDFIRLRAGKSPILAP